MSPLPLIPTAFLLSTLLSAACLAQAPPPNPVFVNDSPEASRMLRQARAESVKNPSESIRLLQQILDDYGDMLQEDDNEPGRFISVRQGAIDLLLSNEELWRRYEALESAEADRLLYEGRLRRLVETRAQTTAGLEGLLILGQLALEAGRIETARAHLTESLAHPRIEGRDKWAALMMMGMSAHAANEPMEYERVMRELEQEGIEAQTWKRALEKWTRTVSPVNRRGYNTLDYSIEELTETSWPALWKNSFQRVPASLNIKNEFDIDAVNMKIQEGLLTAIIPSVSEDRITFSEGADVVQIDLLTGQERWRRSILPLDVRRDRIEDPIGPTTVAIDGNDVVTWTGYSRESGVSETDDVVCLDFSTGIERWRFNLSDTPGIDDATDLYPAGPPIIHEDRVLQLIRRERRQKLKSVYLLALDREDGTPVFTTYIASTSSQSDGRRPLTMPVADGGDVLVSTSLGAVASVDIANGRIKWLQRMATPVSSTMASSRVRPYQLHRPLLINDQVFSLTPDYRSLVRLDRETGRILEKRPLDDQLEGRQPAYILGDQDRIYIVGGSITALDSNNLARRLWTQIPRARGRGKPLPGRVHLAGAQLLVPNGDTILVLDCRTGDRIGAVELKDSSLPLISNGHLIATGPSGVQLYANPKRMAQSLAAGILESPDDIELILSKARLASRTGDETTLLREASRLASVIGSLEEDERVREIRSLILEEILDRIEARSIDADRASEIEALLVELADDTALIASARTALADWYLDFDVPSAVAQYRIIADDPIASNILLEDDGVYTPAGEWSKRRLALISKSHSHLVPPEPEQLLEPTDSWQLRLAKLASNLRAGQTILSDEQTVEILQEAATPSTAEAGLEILDLWSLNRASDDPLADGRSRLEWKEQLLAVNMPEIPRSDRIGGASSRWPGKLVPSADQSARDHLSRRGFLRSFNETITWHDGPDFEPQWSIESSDRELSIPWQDDDVIVIQSSELGRPTRLRSLSLSDGRIIWDLKLPEDVFMNAPEDEVVRRQTSPLTASSWITIEPVGERMMLVHQDGTVLAVDAKSNGETVWVSSLPDHFVQDHAAWRDGVAVIGYRSIDPENPWLNRGPRRGDMILGWFSAETGTLEWTDLPIEIGAASWLTSNEIGDLIVGGTNGVALYRQPGQAPVWISLDRSLHANRRLDGIQMTSKILQTMDLRHDREAFSLETGRKLDLDGLPESAFRTGVPRIAQTGDRQSLLFDRMLVMLDSGGTVVGSNASTRILNHQFQDVIHFSDGMVVLEEIDPRIHSTGTRSSTRKFYRLQVLAPDGKGVEILDLFPLNSKIRAGRAMHGGILLATDENVIAVSLPPAIESP